MASRSALALVLILAIIGWSIVPAVALNERERLAKSCSGNGADLEFECDFTCEEGDSIFVSASGGFGYVTGSCGGAGASCLSSFPPCEDQSATTAVADGMGACTYQGLSAFSCAAGQP